jgi:hypothetical protein
MSKRCACAAAPHTGSGVVSIASTENSLDQYSGFRSIPMIDDNFLYSCVEYCAMASVSTIKGLCLDALCEPIRVLPSCFNEDPMRQSGCCQATRLTRNSNGIAVNLKSANCRRRIFVANELPVLHKSAAQSSAINCQWRGGAPYLAILLRVC